VKTKNVLRCAIYTRKSSEEGLDQTFNSLEAQREACEAYVKSQCQEGWVALPARYDDGGYSGGSMDRPGLLRLLNDVSRGLVHIIVVYKVDRLTRSLADFAKIVEILDRQGVSFVSITQQFNTTTSMGRLTLNVLLSFAQFEREVTGERIRDKIAASKQKGMWMGGFPPLGYDILNRRLAVNEQEAAQVRAIFTRYLELGSVTALAQDLRERRIHSKRWKTQGGEMRGGNAFSRGALYHLLKNRVYLGEVTHRGKAYAGDHPSIVTRSLWDKVQARLSENRRTEGGGLRAPSRALLAGLLFDDRANPMSPAYARKANGTRYRYYVSQALLQHRLEAAGTLPRISAPAIESLVEDQIMARLPKRSRVAGGRLSPAEQAAQVRTALRRVEVAADRVTLVIAKTDKVASPPLAERYDDGAAIAEDADAVSLTIPVRLHSWGGKTVIAAPSAQAAARPRRDHALIKAVVRAHQWKEALLSGGAQSLEDIARQNGCTSRYVRQILELSFLAPDLVDAILAGHQPPGLHLTTLLAEPVPLSWREQRRLFGSVRFARTTEA